MRSYDLEEYVTAEEKSPFGEWLERLNDRRTVARILTRLDRVRLGDFGDYKRIRGVSSLYELREHYGAGYRIFFAIIGGSVILLLAGSSKRDQQRVICKARRYLADYERRA